jgi:hypothetical protein
MRVEFAFLVHNPPLFSAVLDFNGLYDPREGAAFALLDGKRQEALTRALKENPELWRRFEERYPSRLIRALREKPKTWRLLAPRAEVANGSGGVWSFQPLENRLALLPWPILERLSTWWSAVVLSETLIKIIDGRKVSGIKAAFGPEIYGYALRRGRFQLGSLRGTLLRDWSGDLSAEGLLGLHYPGQRFIQLCLALWPEDIERAWRIRHAVPPRELFHKAQNGGMQDEDAAQENRRLFQKIWPWLYKILFTEIAPEWQACFNS